jgi:hypothetical protein
VLRTNSRRAVLSKVVQNRLIHLPICGTYGLRDSFGVMVNYRYIPEELEENHERFVRSREMPVTPALLHERRISTALWKGEKEMRGGK